MYSTSDAGICSKLNHLAAKARNGQEISSNHFGLLKHLQERMAFCCCAAQLDLFRLFGGVLRLGHAHVDGELRIQPGSWRLWNCVLSGVNTREVDAAWKAQATGNERE